MIAWLVLLQTTLTIAVSGPATNPEYWPLHLAEAEGYFAQEKLAVSLEAHRADAGAAEALGRGRVDLAATSLDAALELGHVGGKPPKLVFGLTATPAVVLLVPAAQKDSIRGLADLVGKTIGVPAPGTPEQRVLISLLARAGIRIPQVTVQSYGERGLVGALESGKVAAVVLGDPYATRLVEAGKASPLIDLRKRGELARWLGEPVVHAAIFVRADTALGPAELKPLARALLRAMARVEDASPEEIQARLPATAIGLPEEWRARLLGAREIFLRDGRVTAQMLSASVALVRSRSPIPAKVKIPRSMDNLLLTGPLEEVLGARR
jgi:ABC-type nitrate/sulfonate/bicarbonate transport system substrate-binding protein